MKKADYQQLHDAEQTYWWHVGRLAIIKKQLQKLQKKGLHSNAKILNIGAGTGGTIPTLEEFGEVTNADISKTAIAYLRQAGFKANRVEGLALPYRDSEFDLVGAFDVLEHIKEDQKALGEWYRVLKPGGYMIITVPAYQWLWSNHDEAMHHFRRYNRKQLKTKFKEMPVRIHKASYMIAFSFPLFIGHRLLRQRKNETKTSFVPVLPQINQLFIHLLSVEGSMQKSINFPFGTSVLMVVRKD